MRTSKTLLTVGNYSLTIENSKKSPNEVVFVTVVNNETNWVALTLLESTEVLYNVVRQIGHVQTTHYIEGQINKEELTESLDNLKEFLKLVEEKDLHMTIIWKEFNLNDSL